MLASSAALVLLFWQWRPLGGTIWHVEHEVGRALLLAGFAFGWALVLVATFAINHFDLFGLRQTWRAFRGQPQASCDSQRRSSTGSSGIRLYVGWLLAFWCTPTMTVAHLVFAVMTTAYILMAIQLEERDLMAAHPEYGEYRRRVPMLVPGLR